VSKYRQVQVSFWQDAFVLDLTPEEKYFYIYLMTNSKTSQIGIYELPKRIIEIETGYNRETVNKLLKRFEEYGKISYNEDSREIMLLNWAKYNWNNSPKVIKRISEELRNVKHFPFAIAYLKAVEPLRGEGVEIDLPYSIDTVSIPNRKDKEKDKEKDKDKENMSGSSNADDSSPPYSEIINYLNEKCITRYRASAKETQRQIKARWNEGFRLDDFKKVIDNKSSEWLKDPKMSQYLRPLTLFGTKFESYLQERVIPNGEHQRRNGRSTGTSYEDALAAAERDKQIWGG